MGVGWGVSGGKQNRERGWVNMGGDIGGFKGPYTHVGLLGELWGGRIRSGRGD